MKVLGSCKWGENDSPVVGREWKRVLFSEGSESGGEGRSSLVTTKVFAWVFGWALVLSAVGEENSAPRLEGAQRGMAEASWPRKPDDRLSPLSGKMKQSREISVRYFGQEKEFRAKTADGWMKDAALSQEARWEGTSGRRWEEARWAEGRDWVSGRGQNENFQTSQELAKEHTRTYREVERRPVADWASRSARLVAGRDGSLRMYDGRLTRVRGQVWREEGKGRDLGPGRQEKFSPQEVERMLSRPVGEPRGAATGQSREASPLAAADN